MPSGPRPNADKWEAKLAGSSALISQIGENACTQQIKSAVALHEEVERYPVAPLLVGNEIAGSVGAQLDHLHIPAAQLHSASI